MGSLADLIEQYLRQLLGGAGDTIEVQRRELARMFRCAPSQINYVLETRFSAERGYIIESRRGGGGYIRIRRLEMDDDEWGFIEHEIGSRIDSRSAEDLLAWLQHQGLVKGETVPLIRMVLHREIQRVNEPDDDAVRAQVLRTILAVLVNLRP